MNEVKETERNEGQQACALEEDLQSEQDLSFDAAIDHPASIILRSHRWLP